MALRFLDGWDHYTTPGQKWTSPNYGWIEAVAARTGLYGLRIDRFSNLGPALTLDAQGTWVVGLAYRVSLLGAAGTICSTIDGATQGYLQLQADGTLSLYRGDGTLLASSTRTLLANVFYYIEFKHIIANAGGTLEVRVNEEVWATFAGDTQVTANPTANQIRLNPIAASTLVLSIHFDDLYILDGTGAAPNNDYWGDTQVEALLPNGAGFYTEFATLVGAATHWQAVSEVPPNEDTSYVSDNVVGSRDTFAMGNLSVANATINGIQALIRAREDVAGGVTIARMYRNAGVDNQGADVAINTSYAYWIREIMATDPIAVGAWTVANVNAAEFGVRVRP